MPYPANCRPTMTVEEIDALLAQLDQLRRTRLTGGQIVKSSYAGRAVEFASATMDEINMEIARLKLLRSRLTGCPSGFGPVRPGFGGY